MHCRAVDGATSTLMQLRFVPSESTFSYFETLELYLAAHGRPVCGGGHPESGGSRTVKAAATTNARIVAKG